MKRLLLLIPVLIFLTNCVVSTAILAQTKDNIENLVEVTEHVDEHVDEFYETRNVTRFIDTEMWYGFGKDKNGYKISGKIFKFDDDIIKFNTSSYNVNLGCIDTMEIKLTNSKIVEFAQLNDTDCNDFESVTFIPLSRGQIYYLETVADTSYLTDKQLIIEHNLNLLKQYDWQIIRIRGSEGYTDFKPNYSNGVGIWGLNSDSLKNKLKKPKLYFQAYYHQIGDGAWAVSDNKLQKIQNPEQFFRQHLIAIDQK